MTLNVSFTLGSMSLPSSDLSRPSITFGAVTPRSVDARAVLLGVLEHTFAIPLGNEVERVRVGVLDPHALQVRIEVRDVDELGAALVGRLGGRTRLLLEADLGRDQTRSGLPARSLRGRRARRGE